MSLLRPFDPRQDGGLARNPSVLVALQGDSGNNVLAGVVSAEVVNNGHFTADTFRVELSLSAQAPDFREAYWASAANTRLLIAFAATANAVVPAIIGQLDQIDMDMLAGTISLTGRDLSAQLIDAKTAEKFQNQTASDIAATLAARHGLTADVAPTQAKVGTYYELDHVSLTHDESEWDLLIYLAQREGYDVWVSGTTLNFQPAVDPQKAKPYPLIWSGGDGQQKFANATRLTLSRSQTLAKDVIVIVHSWNQKQQRGFSVTAKRTQAAKNQRRGGEGQTYNFTVPNLDHQAAQDYANQKLAEITRQERVITFDAPGTDALTIRTPIMLTGTGTAFDQTYFPDTITRRMSFTEGYSMTVRAKNHSTESTVTP